MCKYKDFVNDYNNPNLTAHDVRRINQLNGKQYSKIRNTAIKNGDIPQVRHMNTTDAKFYTRTRNGEYQVQKTIDGKKIIVGRFKDQDTAREIVNACINNNWELNRIKGLIDLKKIKPKNYTCINGCWVIQKSVNGQNIVFNSFSVNRVDEETVMDIVDFYREHDWNLDYKDVVVDLFNIN